MSFGFPSSWNRPKPPPISRFPGHQHQAGQGPGAAAQRETASSLGKPARQIYLLLVLESELLHVVMSGTTPWEGGQCWDVYSLLFITHPSTRQAALDVLRPYLLFLP